uniref:Uncharacterized protein n=1 Tax=Arundo donax TaxID=35708 RepID=A0A0A8ZR13_ARUDO
MRHHTSLIGFSRHPHSLPYCGCTLS